jgi:hypothetical protein
MSSSELSGLCRIDAIRAMNRLPSINLVRPELSSADKHLSATRDSQVAAGEGPAATAAGAGMTWPEWSSAAALAAAGATVGAARWLRGIAAARVSVRGRGAASAVIAVGVGTAVIPGAARASSAAAVTGTSFKVR